LSGEASRFRWLAPVALAGVVGISFLATVRPSMFLWVWDLPGADKTGHFVEMGLLAFAIVVGLSPVIVRRRLSLGALACLAVTVALVTLDELAQLVMPHRTFSLEDLGWSYAGIAVFWPLGALVRRGVERVAARRADV
jgi:hypothetical protein